jgi:hypothetical protein
MPHIVASFSTGIFGEKIIDPLEKILAAATPYYVLSPSDAKAIPNIISKVLPESEPVSENSHQRFMGVNVATAEDDSLLGTYELAYRTLFLDANTQGNNFYDAAYFLVYGMLATRVADPRGDQIAGEMRRLLAGPVDLRMGVGDRDAIFARLADPEASLRLIGTMGPPRFDEAYGHRVDEGGVYCFERYLDLTIRYATHPDVLRWDYDQGPANVGLLRYARDYSEDSPAPCLEYLRPYVQ